MMNEENQIEISKETQEKAKIVKKYIESKMRISNV